MSYESVVLADRPQGYWPLTDSSGSGVAADLSGNGWTATASNATFGIADSPIIGGSTVVETDLLSMIISSLDPNGWAGTSAEVWVNLDNQSQSGTGNSRSIASAHTDADNTGFQLISDTSAVEIYFGNGSASNSVTGPGLPASGWTYLAATWDGATITLYVNGVPVGTASLSGTIAPSASGNGVGIGYAAAYSGDHTVGLLAQGAVYDYALTAGQVAAHYAAASGAPAYQPPLISQFSGLL
jgi:hypothetical protein